MKWRDVIWRTREGEEIPLKDMEDDHLLVSISYLDKRIREIADAPRNKALEPSIQAVLYVEMGIQHHLDYLGAAQRALIRERNFRGLSGGTVHNVGDRVIIDLRSPHTGRPGILK